MYIRCQRCGKILAEWVGPNSIEIRDRKRYALIEVRRVNIICDRCGAPNLVFRLLFAPSIQDKWNEMVSWWNQLGPVVWWKNNVAPWFTKAKWDSLYLSIKQSLTDAWNGAVTWWNSLGPVKWWKEDVSPWFTADKWNKIGKDAMNGLWGGLKSIWDDIHKWFSQLKFPHVDIKWHDLSEWNKDAAKALKKMGFDVGVPDFSVDWRANGGIFDSPQVIGVGEAGSEAVVPLSENSEWIEKVGKSVSMKVDAQQQSNCNNDMIRAIVLAADKIVESVESKDTAAYLDGEKITKNVNKRNAGRGYNLGLQST